MKKWLPTITTFIALVLFSLADISIRVYYNMQQENKKVYLLYIWPCTSFEKGWEIKNVQKKDNETGESFKMTTALKLRSLFPNIQDKDIQTFEESWYNG